jgi:uncharacterized membrane protein
MHSSQHSKSKKEIVVGKSPRKVNPLIFSITIALIVAAAGVAYSVWTLPEGPPAGTQTPPLQMPDFGDAAVEFPVSLFSDGKARHFDYQFNGLVIRYFILKSSDGIIRAAFDACDVCWQSGKGYSQSGDVMICNNCNRRFASDRINELHGGCNPAPLTRSIQDDTVAIRIADIVQGHTYFNFQGRI